jgi:Retrotransposon gag protein
MSSPDPYTQQLQQDLQQLQQAFAALQLQPLAQRAPEPKVKLPSSFDGTRSQFRGFINQVQLVFRLQPHRYPTATTQVGLVGTLLTGAALKWFAPLIEKNSALLGSWDAFLMEFEANFGDTDRERTAANKIRRLRQGSRSASEYASEFRQLACDISWDDAALRDQFREGLRDDVKDLLLTFADPTSLDAAIAQAIRCDNRLFERRQEKRFRQVIRAPTPHVQDRPADPSPDVEPMQIDAVRPRGPLTRAERQHRLQANLCLYCGQPGHRLAGCPSRKRIQANTVDATALEAGNGLVQSE